MSHDSTATSSSVRLSLLAVVEEVIEKALPAAIAHSRIGTSLTSRDVRFRAAIGGYRTRRSVQALANMRANGREQMAASRK
jgi:hypothetical protein